MKKAIRKELQQKMIEALREIQENEFNELVRKYTRKILMPFENDQSKVHES